MRTSEWLKLISIPFFTGTIGWLINWTGLIMLFNPVRFHGFKIPGLQDLATLLPRKLQEIPGIMQGGIGWQGIVPARAAKMGSVSGRSGRRGHHGGRQRKTGEPLRAGRPVAARRGRAAAAEIP